jgi:hypothetical protein
MLTVRDIPLPDDARRLLDEFMAAAPERAAGFWERLKSAAAPSERKFLAERAAAARAALTRGTCAEARVRHDTPPALSEHEHGIFVFVPAGEHETLLLEILSIADDPRWRLHRSGALMRAEWRWLRIAGIAGASCFFADGAPVLPRTLPFFHGTALERRLTEEMDWPSDDALLPLSLDEIARLAAESAE